MPEVDNNIGDEHEEQVILEPNPDPNAPVQLSKEEEIEIENTFNNIRIAADAYKMNKLVWDETIATEVDKYWKNCPKISPPKHADKKRYVIIEYGNKIEDSENIRMIAHFKSNDRPSIQTVLSFMNPEGGKELYESTTGNCGGLNGDESQQTCRQYKQIVTAKSHRVGCAMVKCEIGRFSKTTSFRMICAFMPPFPIKRAYIPADAERPAGSGCKEAERGLCIGDQLVGDEDEREESQPQPVEESVPEQENGAHIPITGDEQKEILHALNEIRAGVPALKMNELMWERSLADIADTYGKKCPKLTAPRGADDKRFVIVDPVTEDGKTIGRWMTVYFEGTDRPTVQSALSYMISKAGKDLYDSLRSGNCGFLEDEKTKRECEQYKIVVSSRTNRIGCAMVSCTNWGLGSTKSFRMVCQFVPSFYEKHPAYTPAGSQDPGSGCTTKSEDWPGLCVDEPIEEDEEEQPEPEEKKPAGAGPLDGDEEDEIVHKFNVVRVEARAFAMNKLIWDPDLAAHADEVGKRCKLLKAPNPAETRHFVIVDHKKDRARLTFRIAGAERPHVEVALSYMNLEEGKRIYDNLNGDCDTMKEKHRQQDCLQYKQIVTAKTNRIGCALVKCPQPAKLLGGIFSSQDTAPSFRLICEFVPPYENGIAYTPAGDREPGSGCKKAEGGLCVGEDENTQPKGDSGVILLNDNEKQEVLKILNDARKDARATAMNKLEWNWILEKRAKRLGGECEAQKPPKYLSPTAKEFVRMDIHGGKKHVDSMGMTFHKEHGFRQPTISESFAFIEKAVEKYSDVVRKKDECFNECQLYKQVVWAATEYVGCVIIKCAAATRFSKGNNYPSFRLLCEYQPPYEEKGVPYIRAEGNADPGEECEQQFGKRNESGLCVSTALTEEEKEEILYEHNRVRASTKALAMNALRLMFSGTSHATQWISGLDPEVHKRLNPDLEMRAEHYGSECKKQKKNVILQHRGEDEYGEASVEISVIVTGVSRPTVKEMLSYVTNGQAKYTEEVKRAKCAKRDDECLAYSQAVWGSTTDIGCAMIKCPTTNISLSSQSFGGVTNLLSSVDRNPSIRMICEYRSVFSPFIETAKAYVEAVGHVLPGSECWKYDGRRSVPFDEDNHNLCVEQD